MSFFFIEAKLQVQFVRKVRCQMVSDAKRVSELFFKRHLAHRTFGQRRQADLEKRVGHFDRRIP